NVPRLKGPSWERCSRFPIFPASVPLPSPSVPRLPQGGTPPLPHRSCPLPASVPSVPRSRAQERVQHGVPPGPIKGNAIGDEEQTATGTAVGGSGGVDPRSGGIALTSPARAPQRSVPQDPRLKAPRVQRYRCFPPFRGPYRAFELLLGRPSRAGSTAPSPFDYRSSRAFPLLRPLA